MTPTLKVIHLVCACLFLGNVIVSGVWALLARAATAAVKAPAVPDVTLSPVPAIHYLVDIESRERNPLAHEKPWTVPVRSFDERVVWMVELFGRLEQREKTPR